MTETLSCDVGGGRLPEPPAETEFEKRRGVSEVEVRRGFAQVHVEGLGEPIPQERIRVLEAVADIDVSLDFLKLTPDGLSFLVLEHLAESVAEALEGSGVRFSLRTDRSILLIHAVNMRDEEGMIASIVQDAIATGATIDHIGDMHDRLLLVVGTEEAAQIAQRFGRALSPRKRG